MSQANPIYLYRMLHWQNVAYVLHYGLCCRTHAMADPDYINIGHRQLIEDRHDYAIPLPNKGSLGEYIPFYFAGHSPMLYLIMHGFKGVEQRPQEDIVFVVTTFDQIQQAGCEFVFTNMNAKIAIANYYDQEADFDKIKWDIVRSKNWASDEFNIGRQDYKQAEFLVRNYLSVDCIKFLVVKTEERRIYFQKIITNLGLDITVGVDAKLKLYY